MPEKLIPNQEESIAGMTGIKMSEDRNQLSTPGRTDIGWLLVGGGVAGVFLLLIRMDRRTVSWAVSAIICS